MAQRHHPPGWQSRDEERRFLRDEDHRSGRDGDDGRRMRRAHERYSGSDQGEARQRAEGVSGARYRRGAGSYGGGMERRDGDFRGIGPKGYARSDERIRDDVCDALTDDPYLDASHIEVSVKDGEVTLDGMVGSRHDKRAAEDLAEGVTGARHVQNNLRVDPAESRADKSQRH
jgi:osmotically-inducible protein OsmY